MNRRKAIFSMFLIGGGVAASYSGYKYYQIHKTPDLKYLDDNKPMIADLAEVIIPKTNTVGAKETMVHETIIRLVKNVSDRKSQNNFIDGLKAVHSYSNSNYDKLFTQLTMQEQTDVVKHFQKKSKSFNNTWGKIKNKLLGKPFFGILKEYTTIGYCTSKPGATETLAYDYIPGKYEPCMLITPNQKSWATK